MKSSSTEIGMVTLFTSEIPTYLVKRYSLRDKKLEKANAGAMTKGRFSLRQFSNAAQLADLLTAVGTNQALCNSVPVGDDQEGTIVTREVAESTPRPGQLARTKDHFKFKAQPGVMVLDYDPPNLQPALTRDELWARLTELCPAVQTTQCVWWCSGSSHIHGPEGEIQGLRGQRLYLVIRDASDIERAGRNLADRCWLAGMGYIKISTSGSRLPRTLFDEAMHQPARLDFIGGALFDPPLWQERGQPVLMGGGDWLDTRQAFPDLDDHETAMVKRSNADALEAAAPAAAAVRAKWLEWKIDAEAPRLQAAKQITLDEARQQVRLKYEKALDGTLNGDFEIPLPDEKFVTVDEVLSDPDKWHGVKTLDPIEPEHRGGEDCGKLYLKQASPNLFTLAHGGLTFKLLHSRDDNSQPTAPHLSEIALAEEFAAMAADKFRWSPGMEWMHNLGSHWERDTTLQRYKLVKAICKGAATTVARTQLKTKTTSASTTHAVLSLARSEAGIVTGVKEWDAHPMILNTPGGAYDLATGEPFAGESLLFTQVTGVAPTRTATPMWDRFIADIFDNDLEVVEFIQRLGGYALTGCTTEQKLFYLYGSGANGKSVFLEVLRNIAGAYAHNLPSEALMTSKHERHPTTFAALQSKRLAISSEIEDGAHWAESKIKSLTGDATMTAHFMRQDEFEFTITHKHILAGNFKPRLKGDDPAVVRRMVLIPFNQTFSGSRRDDRLSEKLRTEYPGILHWFIEGAVKWAQSGLKIPVAVINSSSEYMSEQNDIAMWIDDACEVGTSLEDSVKNLYASYATWKEEQGEKPQSAKAWSERLLKTANRTFRRLARIEGARDRGIAGLRVRDGQYVPSPGTSYARRYG